MSTIISITLLLLITGAVTSWGPTEEGFKESAGVRAGHSPKEVGAFPGQCRACKYIVAKVKKKLGHDNSKEKIEQLLNKICNPIKISLIKSACEKLINKYKEKLIDALAAKGCPKSVCVKLGLCK